jgi:hypothetical protein
VTGRDRRALALGGLAIALALGGLRGLPWLWSHMSKAHDEALARRELLHRAEADLRTLPALQDSAKRLTEGVIGLAPRLLAGASSSEAIAGLSGHLTHLGIAHQARLDRTDPVPDSTAAGDLRRVSMDAVFESDVRGLAGLLAGFATAQPVTNLTRLRVTAADPTATGRGPEVLRIEVRVEAWYLDREAS